MNKKQRPTEQTRRAEPMILTALALLIYCQITA